MLRVGCILVSPPRVCGARGYHGFAGTATITVSSMSRHCTRQGCVHPAAVTLTYQYARSLVWLDDLTPERDPHSYDLCTVHADRTKAPTGWHLEDRRHRVHVYDSGRLAG